MALTKFNIDIKSQRQKNYILKGLLALSSQYHKEIKAIPESFWKEKKARRLHFKIREINLLYGDIKFTKGSQK